MRLHVHEIAWRDPICIFDVFSEDSHIAWLDSAATEDMRSRYSYLCIEPFEVLEVQGSCVTVNGVSIEGDPFEALQRELSRWRLEPGIGPVPFVGGAVGFLGYELGGYLERLPQRHLDQVGIPDMVMAFYDIVIAFDAEEQRCWILSSGFPETVSSLRRYRAATRADAVLRRLQAATTTSPRLSRINNDLSWYPELTQNEYEAKVNHVLNFIRAGDIFQANFTMRHLANKSPNQKAVDIYKNLRMQSPAPFGAFIACGPRLSLASASPERFLQLDAAGRIETRPIKGTRPRYADMEMDAAAATELATSEKDRAENLMIVDLLRNDIGRIAEIGSVKVPSLFEVESFASVHHLVSVVEGKLRPGLGPVDLLRATFPGGSVTGAPKIRAIEIINELEVARRGPYCGSIVWIGFDGTMDSNIIIRTLVITPELVIAQAGGGIVADSNPTDEYQEQLEKIRPLLRALGRNQTGKHS
ncbi:MAG: aminodeoxychorismate synthase component I [Acidocella sp.]|nr:aminodeoxychorismate synthase component I [Acidocella sp.]